MLSLDYAQMSGRVRETLQKAFSPNAAIRTEPGDADKVYVRVVSDCFDGIGERAKQDMIWEVLRRGLQAESQAVALVIALGTDQI